MEDAAILINARNAGEHLFLQNIQFPVGRHHRVSTINYLVYIVSVGVERIVHFLEHPGATEGSATYHGCIYAEFGESTNGIVARNQVSVANNRDVHARILLYLANECPVGLTSVHLRTRSSVNCERFNTAILKLFGKGNNNLTFFVPSQACLYRYRHIYGIHNGTRYFEHQGNILQHPCSGTFSRHFLHGTPKVDVENVGARRFNHNLCSVAASNGVFAVYLNDHGALFVAHGEFLQTLIHHAYECIGGYKFGVNH